jgi:hypothetical protein
MKTPTSADLFELTLGEKTEHYRWLEKDGEKRVSAIDVIVEALGVSRNQAAEILRRLFKRHPEVKALCVNLKFPGAGQKLTPCVNKHGLAELIPILPTGDKRISAERRHRIDAFRKKQARLLVGFLEADPSIAASIVERMDSAARAALAGKIIDQEEDPERLAWLENRARAKGTNLALNGGIKAAGGDCYASAARLNSLGATGHFPREIREKRQVKKAREGLTTAELAALAFEEAEELAAIESRGAQGNGPILAVVSEISDAVATLRRRNRGGLPAPAPAKALPSPEESPLAPAASPELATALYTLSLLRSQGYRLWLDGKTPRIGRGEGAPPLTADLVATLSAKRAAFIEALRTEAAEGTTL